MFASCLSSRSCSALLLAAGLVSAPALAQTPAPTYTITAENVTISRTATGAIPWTLTSVNGFTGRMVVNCNPPDEMAGVNIPICGAGLMAVYTLNADQVITGSFGLYPAGTPQPASFAAIRNPALAIFLALVLLGPLALRRKRISRWLTLPLFVAALSLLVSTTGCGTAPQSGFTPGTYTYTITTNEYPPVVPLGRSVTVTVTIQ